MSVKKCTESSVSYKPIIYVQVCARPGNIAENEFVQKSQISLLCVLRKFIDAQTAGVVHLAQAPIFILIALKKFIFRCFYVEGVAGHFALTGTVKLCRKQCKQFLQSRRLLRKITCNRVIGRAKYSVRRAEQSVGRAEQSVGRAEQSVRRAEQSVRRAEQSVGGAEQSVGGAKGPEDEQKRL